MSDLNMNDLNLSGFLETHNDVCKVREIVDRRGAAFVIDQALKHQRAKEQAAQARYQKERDAMIAAAELGRAVGP